MSLILGGSSPFTRLHVIAFSLTLAGWTIALLMPVPHQSAEVVLGDPFGVYLFGKSLHVATYAFLSILGGTAARFGRRKWWIFPGLVLHGCATEFVQPYVGRTGALLDVGFDALGIALGCGIVVAVQAVNRRPATKSSSAGGDSADSSPPHPHPSGPPSPSREGDSR